MTTRHHALDYEIDIPFTPNRGRRCAPACTKMILDHLVPDMHVSEVQAEQLSGFQEGHSTWAAQHLLSLDDLGFEVGWIQDEDLPTFADNPEEFILQQVGHSQAQFDAFAQTNDIQTESARIREYLDRGLHFEKRDATKKDIARLALNGYVVRLEVNGKSLANQPGDLGHAVLVSGFSETHIRLENPDGTHGPKPKQLVTWSRLDDAWKGYHALQYYKPETNSTTRK